MEHLHEIVKHFGSQASLARAVNVTRQAITLWKMAGVIPPGAAVEIERLTDGKFKAINLVEKRS